jgi:hypothetical protein
MSEDTPQDSLPIQEGVDHGPYEIDDEIEQQWQHRYAAEEAYGEGRIDRDARDMLDANAQAAQHKIYEAHGVAHGPYPPLSPEEEVAAAHRIKKDYGYVPEGSEKQLLQESHQLKKHGEAVEDAYYDYYGISHDEKEERWQSIADAETDIHYEHEANKRDRDEKAEEDRYYGVADNDDEKDSDPEREAGGGTTNQERIAASYYSQEELDRQADLEDLYDEEDTEDPLAGDVDPTGGYDESEYVDIRDLEVNEDKFGNVVDGHGNLIYPEDEENFSEVAQIAKKLLGVEAEDAEQEHRESDTQTENSKAEYNLNSKELASSLTQLTSSEFREGVSKNGWEKVVYKRYEPGYKWHHHTLGDGSDNPDFSFIRHSSKHYDYAERVNINKHEDGGFDMFIHKIPEGRPHYGGDGLRADVINGSSYTRLHVNEDGAVTGERFVGQTMSIPNIGYGHRTEIMPPTEIRGIAPKSQKSDITDGDINDALNDLKEIISSLASGDALTKPA